MPDQVVSDPVVGGVGLVFNLLHGDSRTTELPLNRGSLQMLKLVAQVRQGEPSSSTGGSNYEERFFSWIETAAPQIRYLST